MQFIIRAFLVFAIAAFLLPESGKASVVFKPGQKAKYVAPGELYRSAQLQEQLHQFTPAAESFRELVERYPGSPHFEEAIEAQFRVGEIYLNGKKLKFLGIPLASALDRAVTIFANVVRTAPYGKYTA